MNTPIPNTCKTQELDKCKKNPRFGPRCKEINICQNHTPLYSWRDVSDYYTCPKCFDSCDWIGCSTCNPKGFREAVESMYFSDIPKDKTYYDLIDEPNKYKLRRIKYFILWSLRKILPIRISDCLYYIF